MSTTRPDPPRYLRAAVASLVGGLVGALVGGPVTGWVLGLTDRGPEGLAALIPVLAGAAVGSFVGGAVAVAIAFRDEDRRGRLLPATAVLIGGPVVFFGSWELLAPVNADILSPQLVLAVTLAATAVAGRWLGTRHSGGS